MIRHGKRLRKTIPFARTNAYIDRLEHCRDVYLGEIKNLVEQRDECVVEADASRASLESVTAYHNRFVGDFVKFKERCEALERENSALKELNASYDRALDAKDSRIADLNAALKLAADHVDAAVKEKDDALRVQDRKLSRLYSEHAGYDSDAVYGVSEEAARKAVELAEKNLRSGGKVSFGVACAIRLHKSLASATRQHRGNRFPPMTEMLIAPTGGVLSYLASSGIYDPNANGNNGR
jgi:chromosome segregation ATPase